MRELCANTIYKFVNRFSFVAKAVVKTTRRESADYCFLLFLINDLIETSTAYSPCHAAHSASQHKVNN